MYAVWIYFSLLSHEEFIQGYLKERSKITVYTQLLSYT